MNTFRPWPDGPVRYPLAPQTLPGPQAPWQRMSPLARDIYPFPNRAGSPASGIPAWQQAAQWQQMGPVPYAPATEGTYTRQQVSPKTGASAVMDVVANGPQAQGYGGVSMPPTYDVPGPFTGTGYNTSYDQPAGGSPAETTVTVGGGAGGRARVTTTPYAPSFSPRMRDRNTNLNASGNRITAVPKYQESLLNALTGAAGTLSGAAMSRGMRVDGTNDAGGNVDTSVSDAGVKPTSSFMDVLGQAALGITPFISDMVNARLTARTPNVPRPTLQRPVKLDTEIETGPAEAAIRAQNRSTNRALSAGIGDSARLVASQLMAGSQATKQLNDLHYNASMAETQLRNQEKGMNAEIAGQNVNRVNAFKNQQLMRELGIQGRKSETATSIGTKLQGMMRDKRLSETDRLGFEMIAKALNTYGTISRNFVDALKKRGGAYADIALELERKGLIDDGG